jgi:hypothetical protein
MANKMKYLVKGGPRPEEFSQSELGEWIRNPNYLSELSEYNSNLSPYSYAIDSMGGAAPMMYKEADYYGVPDWIKQANPNTDYTAFDDILRETASMAASDASGAITPETLIRAAARKANLPNGEFSVIGKNILDKIDPDWEKKGPEYLGGMDPTKEDWGLSNWTTGKVTGGGGLGGLLSAVGKALSPILLGGGLTAGLGALGVGPAAGAMGGGAAGAGATGLASLPSAGTWAQTAIPGLAEAGGAAAAAGSLTGGAGYLSTLANAGLPIDAATGAMTGAGISGGGSVFDELINTATSNLPAENPNQLQNLVPDDYPGIETTGQASMNGPQLPQAVRDAYLNLPSNVRQMVEPLLRGVSPSFLTNPQNVTKLLSAFQSIAGGGSLQGALQGLLTGGQGGDFNWLNAIGGLTNAFGNYDASRKMEELYNNLLARGDYFTRTDRSPYRDQLLRSYTDPNYLQNDPGWAGQRNMIVNDTSRAMSAQGYNMSGNQMQEVAGRLLDKQAPYLQGQQQNLANVAGAQFGPEWMGSLTANMSPMIANRFNMTTSPLFASSGGSGGATGNQSGTNGGANWGSFLPAASNAVSQFGNWLGQQFQGGGKPSANTLSSWANDGIDWSAF